MSLSKGPKVQRITGMRGGSLVRFEGLNDEDILTGTGRTDGPIPNGSEVSEVVFSDAENLPLVASLCRWQRCKAVMPDLIGHPNKEKNNGTEEQRRSPESEQGAEEKLGRHRKIQRSAI